MNKKRFCVSDVIAVTVKHLNEFIGREKCKNCVFFRHHEKSEIVHEKISLSSRRVRGIFEEKLKFSN